MMNRRLLFLTLVLSLLTGLTMVAKPITKEQARQRAAAFLKAKKDSKTLAPVTNLKRLAPRTSTTNSPYYVFDRGENEGFVIVSGDDQTVVDVLGYCDEGRFDYEQLPPNLQALLNSYANQISQIQDKGLPVVTDIPTHPKVEPLMKCTWNQSSPYNNLCPLDGGKRSVTGCVATAMAQILYYHREKSVTEIQADIPSYTTWTKQIEVPGIAAGSPIDWEHMKDEYSSSTDLQKKAVANLMLYCGVSVKMDYTSSSSGATPTDAYDAFLNYFGYSSSIRLVTDNDAQNDVGWDRIVYAEMAAGRPVLICGYTGNNEGHAFVAHGYDGNLHYRINWGWGGQSDGWYYLTNLTPGDGQGIGGSSSGYNLSKFILIGLEPDNYLEKKMSFTDATIKSICLANFDADKDGAVTYGEAASVTSLGSDFKGLTTIKSFPELYYFTSLTELDDDVFNSCTQLATIRLPKSLKKVGARAFKNCEKLKQINLPTSVSYIGEEAFSGCKVLADFVVPEEISMIGKETFKGCTQLTSIDLPITVEKIGDEAFANCSKLTSFQLHTFHPDAIEMGSGVFEGVDLQKAVLYVMQGTKSYYTSTDQWKEFGKVVEEREISAGKFADLEVGKTYYLYNVGTGRYLTMGEAYGTQAVVGSDPMRFVFGHSSSMAEDVYYLTSPDTGLDGKYLFRTSTDGNVGNGIQAVFVDGNALSKPAHWTVKKVSDKVYTFQIPSSQDDYVAELFLGVQTDHPSNAASPTYGVYPDVEYATHQKNCHWQLVLYDEDFTAKYEAANTLGSLVTMAKKRGVSYTKEQAVYDNLDSTIDDLLAAQSSLRKRLKLIEFSEDYVRTVCLLLYDSNNDNEISYTEAAQLEDLGWLSYSYFQNQTSLKSFDELQYFKNVKEIYGNTFQGCTNLESVVLPEGLDKIYYHAFYNCKKLPSIRIPEYVNLIGENCFYGCSSLREVTMANPDPSTIQLGNNVFAGVSLANCTLYVPYGSKELYAAAPVWKNFGNIVEVRMRTQPQLTKWEAGIGGYVYNLGTRKMLTMGEAYGTQSVVSRQGRAYQLKRNNNMPEGVYYLYDNITEKVVFRTATDTKVGEGVKACFGDGNLSEKAYWKLTLINDSVFTLQVPENYTDYVDGEYLGTNESHSSAVASPTSGVYWDVKGNTKNIQWGIISVEEMAAAQEMDDLLERLKTVLDAAKKKNIDVAEEQAVYDNIASTKEQIRVAITSGRAKMHYITFADSKVGQICIDNWDADGDGELTFEEAAAVTDIGENFRGLTSVKSFEELRYFTSLVELPSNAFRGSMSLQTIFLPSGVSSIGEYAFTGCTVLRYIVVLNDKNVIPMGLYGINSGSTVFVPANMVESYKADEAWTSKCLVVEYTGIPVVSAEASRGYGRTAANINIILEGAPIDGTPEFVCESIADSSLPVGTYPITVAPGTIITPGVVCREGVFTITPATLIVTANSYTRGVGEDNPTFEMTFKGFRNRETIEVLDELPVVSCAADKNSPAGEYEITVSGGQAKNYVFSYVSGMLTVTNDPSGIETVKADDKKDVVIDLQGRRVTNPKRGIYVIGKRKMVVK